MSKERDWTPERCSYVYDEERSGMRCSSLKHTEGCHCCIDSPAWALLEAARKETDRLTEENKVLSGRLEDCHKIFEECSEILGITAPEYPASKIPAAIREKLDCLVLKSKCPADENEITSDNGVVCPLCKGRKVHLSQGGQECVCPTCHGEGSIYTHLADARSDRFLCALEAKELRLTRQWKLSGDGGEITCPKCGQLCGHLLSNSVSNRGALAESKEPTVRDWTPERCSMREGEDSPGTARCVLTNIPHTLHLFEHSSLEHVWSLLTQERKNLNERFADIDRLHGRIKELEEKLRASDERGNVLLVAKDKMKERLDECGRELSEKNRLLDRDAHDLISLRLTEEHLRKERVEALNALTECGRMLGIYVPDDDAYIPPSEAPRLFREKIDQLGEYSKKVQGSENSKPFLNTGLNIRQITDFSAAGMAERINLNFYLSILNECCAIVGDGFTSLSSLPKILREKLKTLADGVEEYSKKVKDLETENRHLNFRLGGFRETENCIANALKKAESCRDHYRDLLIVCSKTLGVEGESLDNLPKILSEKLKGIQYKAEVVICNSCQTAYSEIPIVGWECPKCAASKGSRKTFCDQAAKILQELHEVMVVMERAQDKDLSEAQANLQVGTKLIPATALIRMLRGMKDGEEGT